MRPPCIGASLGYVQVKQEIRAARPYSTVSEKPNIYIYIFVFRQRTQSTAVTCANIDQREVKFIARATCTLSLSSRLIPKKNVRDDRHHHERTIGRTHSHAAVAGFSLWSIRFWLTRLLDREYRFCFPLPAFFTLFELLFFVFSAFFRVCLARILSWHRLVASETGWYIAAR